MERYDQLRGSSYEKSPEKQEYKNLWEDMFLYGDNPHDEAYPLTSEKVRKL